MQIYYAYVDKESKTTIYLSTTQLELIEVQVSDEGVTCAEDLERKVQDALTK